jgi:UDP-N-acetyl-D-galactosamine dehydrogenase
MNLYDKLISKNEKLSVIGLGYVGLPLAVLFSTHLDVVGFDISSKKINLYKNGIDATNEVGDEKLKNASIDFTYFEERLKEARFHIVAVPTPVNANKIPDLSPVINASKLVGRNLQKDSIVVFESTVYPGVTEDVCIPILEQASGLKCEVDFNIGYSPERINPGDKVHRLENINKIVSAQNEESLDIIAKIYELIITASVYKAPSIRVAEAAKVVENSQRDINIAFMNELAIVFDKMNIDTKEVIDAMNTKWNALGFYPGLVGGHCIGVDPYYFIYEAEKLGYHSQIILAGRKINDGMGSFVADTIIKKLILANKQVKQAKVIIFGIAFKENCADTRNSKVYDIIKRLREYEIDPIVIDPIADIGEAKKEYNLELKQISEAKDSDCLVFAVAHNEFKNIDLEAFFKKCPNNEKIIIDVKSMLDKNEILEKGYSYWRL